MNKTTLIGIDLAKSVFHLHAIDSIGNKTKTSRLNRIQLKEFLVRTKPVTVAMEACGSAHYWARFCQSYGHEVRLISPQFVKPFVKSNKNDRNDAKAICEAAQRPDMHFVPVKSVEQQAIMSLHRVREILVGQRTAIINQLRGLLTEFGITIGVGRAALFQEFGNILVQIEQELPNIVYQSIKAQWEHLNQLNQRIDTVTKTIHAHANQCEQTRRLQTIPGIGPLSASALFTQVGDAKQFKNGRQMAAWLGLVPRQHSTGGKPKLLGISKRGDCYTRKLLIHGARTVIRHCKPENTQKALEHSVLNWVNNKHANVAATALANRNARVAWALMVKERDYDARLRSELSNQFAPA